MAVDYAPLDEEEDRITPTVILPATKAAPPSSPLQVTKFNNDSSECNYLIIAFIICILFIIQD